MPRTTTKLQFSAGGVAFRNRDQSVEVVLISVGTEPRWQLPKGLVNRGESTESAALREVREETGIETEIVERIDKVEYWYLDRKANVRYHKFVYFYLLRFKSGDVRDHDDEVNEARWYEIGKGIDALAFNNEKKIVQRAGEMIEMLYRSQ
jgi:ADP-ribose pyrophosphatase YjhB (NUDIX family)